jgi:hypothetical protein
MVRLEGTFLVRCWHLHDDRQRIELEHIQTGAQMLVISLADAMAWIEAEAEDPVHRYGEDLSGGKRETLPSDEPKQQE